MPVRLYPTFVEARQGGDLLKLSLTDDHLVVAVGGAQLPELEEIVLGEVRLAVGGEARMNIIRTS